MLKLYVFGLILFSFLISLFVFQSTHAVSPNLVISSVQLGNASSASNEFVEIYNNNPTEIDITNWCLYYSSANSTIFGSRMTCFTPENDNLHIYLPAYMFAFAISNQLATSQPNLGSDLRFSATLSGASGHVRLVNNAGQEVDKIGWGTSSVSAEGSSPTDVPSIGKILSRKGSIGSTLQDTDINSDDIEVTSSKAVYTYGSIFEQQDVCANLNDIQASVPEGYLEDSVNNCIPKPVDVCLNLDGLQTVIPNEMKLGGVGVCLLDLLYLKITELFPNPSGIDEGKEFIEIYNPNDTPIDLAQYRLLIGSSETEFKFPVNSKIDSNQYLSFSNEDLKFTLTNTSSIVKLVSSDYQAIDESPAYNSPNDGMAWVIIDELWQYTNQPTPSNTNLTSLIEPNNEEITSNNLTPCAANQYRNPETNRCRLLATSISMLTPCKDGQYRSEETNRCRSLALDVSHLMPCAEGQERNPATNRCRSVSAVLGVKELTPCKVGQERNPETNRCRNKVSAIPAASYAPEQTNEVSNNSILMWSLISVGAIAICYGIWEWRQEIVNIFKKTKFGYHKK